jgi:hypothetical protein
VYHCPLFLVEPVLNHLWRVQACRVQQSKLGVADENENGLWLLIVEKGTHADVVFWGKDGEWCCENVETRNNQGDFLHFCVYHQWFLFDEVIKVLP